MSSPTRRVVTADFPRRAVQEHRQNFVQALPFKIEPFQQESFDALDRGNNVLVSAPTGSGKTLVAEYAISSAFRLGNRAIYTSPIKALTNQKFKELSVRFGVDNVGLLTGDNVINGDAPIVCMTTEVLRNMIYADKPGLETVDFVVLDEVHYLQNADRGPVWEEVIIHLDPAVKLVCLSATISNADQFANWITTIRGETEVISSDRRPVPLNFLFGARVGDELRVVPLLNGAAESPSARIHRDAVTLDRRANEIGDAIDKAYRRSSGGRGRGKIGSGGGARRPSQRGRRSGIQRGEVFDFLEERDMAPAIWFKMSRRGCDEAAREVFSARTRHRHYLDDSQIRQVDAIIARHTQGIEADLGELNFDEFAQMLRSGIGVHHAGCIPPFKEAVEECLGAGLLKVVFATETLAYGINMPVRTVVLDQVTKRTKHAAAELLTASDFTQLTGRAGRRLYDPTGGYVMVFHDDQHGVDEIGGLALNRTFVLSSAFHPTYNIAANLVRRYSRESAARVLNQSFAQFIKNSDVTRLDTELGALEKRISEGEQVLSGINDFEGLMTLIRRRDDLTRQIHAHDEASRANNTDNLKAGDVIADPADPTKHLVIIIDKTQPGKKGMRIIGLRMARDIDRVVYSQDDFTLAPTVVGRVDLPKSIRPNDAKMLERIKTQVAAANLRPPSSLSPLQEGGRKLYKQFTAERDELDRAISVHPAKTHPRFNEARRMHADLNRLRHLADRQMTQLRGRGDALAREFGLVQDVLVARGYLDKSRWALTAKGDILANTYCETDLVFVETLWDGHLNGLSPAQLAAAASSFVYETRGKDDGPIGGVLKDKRIQDVFTFIERINEDVQHAEKRARVTPSRSPDFGFANVAYLWASGKPIEDIFKAAPTMSGGDFVRQTKQVMDVLRQLGDLASELSPKTATTARQAAALMNRGIVEASSRVLTEDDLFVDDVAPIAGAPKVVVRAVFGAENDGMTEIGLALQKAGLNVEPPSNELDI